LVAKGFQQTAGLDYDETFSPVVKSSTLRTVLSIAIHLNLEVRQLDINNTFLNDNLKENVFMHQLEGYTDSTKLDHICKLKAIHGLKQAPRAWYDKLKDTLLRLSFQNTKSDSSLFVLRENNHIILLLIYVDDIIIIESNNKSLETFITQLNIAFSLNDLGLLHYFLRIEVHKDVGGMYLKQTKYIKDLLKKFNMEKSLILSYTNGNRKTIH